MNIQIIMVSYHFMTYFGFCFFFFGGLDLELVDLTSLICGLVSSLPDWTFVCMVSCLKPVVISATLSLRDFRLFLNCDAGSNLIGVCARIWFWPSNPTGWLWNVDIISYLSRIRSPRDGTVHIQYYTLDIPYVRYAKWSITWEL